MIWCTSYTHKHTHTHTSHTYFVHCIHRNCSGSKNFKNSVWRGSYVERFLLHMPLSVIMLNLDRSYVVMKQASLCVLFFCALVGPQKLLATVKRRKLAWSRHVKRHDKGASPKPSMRTTLRVGDTMVGRENAGWSSQRVDIPARARTAHNSLLQKRLEEDISTESFMSSRRPSHSRD